MSAVPYAKSPGQRLFAKAVVHNGGTLGRSPVEYLILRKCHKKSETAISVEITPRKMPSFHYL